MAKEPETTSSQALRLYRDLADWYPLLTPVDDYAEETAFYRRLFETHCQRPLGPCSTSAAAAATMPPT